MKRGNGCFLEVLTILLLFGILVVKKDRLLSFMVTGERVTILRKFNFNGKLACIVMCFYTYLYRMCFCEIYEGLFVVLVLYFYSFFIIQCKTWKGAEKVCCSRFLLYFVYLKKLIASINVYLSILFLFSLKYIILFWIIQRKSSYCCTNK